jgi:hypothetical protein
MNTLATKTIIILLFALSPCVFALSFCETEEEHRHENIITEKEKGMIITKKFISYNKGPHPASDNSSKIVIIAQGNHEGPHVAYDSRKEVVTIHDEKGNLLFSKDYTYIGDDIGEIRNDKLVQTIDDGVVRNIAQGKTPCDFAIVEPSGDSVFFHLDAKKEPESVFFTEFLGFMSFFNGYNILFNEGVKYEIHDAIIYHWYFRCKKYYETQELINSSDDSAFFLLDTEIEQNIPVEDNSFLSYISSYKYYLIITVCVTIAGVVVVRKRRKSGK